MYANKHFQFDTQYLILQKLQLSGQMSLTNFNTSYPQREPNKICYGAMCECTYILNFISLNKKKLY